MMARDTFSISSEGPQCPYCGHQVTADVGKYYDEHGYVEDKCDDCEEVFTVSVSNTTTWMCEQVDLPSTSS